nr:retrovirus-related Pol polyprotein from transposon TNT 1-94 [Tanacetum cinerariifolium]GEY37133.1 retrovirus-related Pol polyprotein from transposon TNT 1-94 [Tanacetum cinerariifolium]
MDVKTAFFSGILKEEVYVGQPPCFVNKQYPDHVYALDKALFRMENCDTVPTPMVEQAKLQLDLVGKLVDHTDYRSMIGSLMYVTSSRQDIMFATCMCSRYQANPNEHHVSAVKRIFRYLKGTINLGLWYPKDSGFDLTAYSDADHARCHLDRKTESEYVAVSSCCAQVLWMRTQLTDYGLFYDKVPIYCYSNSAIAISSIRYNTLVQSTLITGIDLPRSLLFHLGKLGLGLLKIQVAQKKVNIAFENADSSSRVESISSKIKYANKEQGLIIAALRDKLRTLKGKSIVDTTVTTHTIDLEMLKVDVEPIAPRLLNNRTVHSNYLRLTQEQAAILREVVKQEKSQNPFNNSLDHAFLTPMVEQAKLKLDLVRKPVDHQSMIGSLMYVTSSRPDIMFATCMCARYQANPNEHHVSAVKRIFRYLKRTINIGLWYLKDSGFDLTAYSDANNAGCHLDRKTTYGSVQFLGDKLVCWSSKKQNCVFISTPEYEYVVVSSCCAQVLWIRTQLTDYGFFYDKVPIYCDSKSAIAISCNPVQHTRTKHIDVKYHFIKDHVEKRTIELYFVGTEYQLADLFTKSLPKARFKFLVEKLGMMSRET